MFRGEQLVMPINSCNIDCACLGNHELVGGSVIVGFWTGPVYKAQLENKLSLVDVKFSETQRIKASWHRRNLHFGKKWYKIRFDGPRRAWMDIYSELP